MKIIISSFGSSGDFNPCLGIARALLSKGSDVIFLSNPYYEKTITGAGVRFYPAGNYWDVFKEIQSNPAYLHPRKGPKAVWALVLKTVPVMYNAMKTLIHNETPDRVACHLLDFGSLIAAMDQSVPCALLSPNPMSWFGTKPPGYLNFTELPLWIRRVQAHCLRGLMNVAFQYSLKQCCRKHGIPTLFETIDQLYSKVCLNLGLWSVLLKDYTQDDPPNGKICGFVRDAHVCDWDNVPEAVIRLFNGSVPPVVAGLGSTASLHADAIYRSAAQACKQLNRPCLLVGKNLGRYADPEKNVLATDFAPYGWVFPRSAMVIHHGGLNTTAETLRAGVPALIIPHGYDQFDNAIQTAHLGLSRRIKPNDADTAALTKTIQSILADTRMNRNAQLFAVRLRAQPDGADVAAETLIQSFRTGNDLENGLNT